MTVLGGYGTGGYGTTPYGGLVVDDPAPAPARRTGWRGLHLLFTERGQVPARVACPHDGVVLQYARGVRYCPHGDFREGC